MTEIVTLEAASASPASGEPVERKARITGIVPVTLETSRGTKVVTVTEPTPGLVPVKTVCDPLGYTQFLLLALNGGNPIYLPMRELSAAAIVEYVDWYSAYHFLALPEGTDADDYARREAGLTFHNNPWTAHEWFHMNMGRWVEHLPRPSETVPGNIGYFQSPAKRARNIRTPIKPGRYLKKYFGDLLSETEIHEAALEWQNHFALRALKVTQDADEIEAVYRGRYNGSCMWFQHGDYEGSCHPARVYAGPDLGIAYIGDRDNADARCLVWPEKKIYYPKWYGDGSRLEASLIAEGYKVGYEGDFEGARLQRIEYGDGFVVPYVDVCCDLADHGDYLVIPRYGGDVHCRNTSGISFEPQPCADCGDNMSEDEQTTVYNGECVCDSCLSDGYFLCEGYEEYYPDDRRAETPDGTAYSQRYVDSHDFFYCDVTELYYPERRYSQVSLVEGGHCVEDHAEANGFYCEYSQEWSLEVEEKLTLTDGSFVHSSAADGGTYFTDWLEREGKSLGTIPHDDQLDMLEAA